MIFYLGHLEAFDWNLLGPKLDLPPQDAEFDKLFAFGIDPVDGGLPTDVPADWPTIAQVENYSRKLRARWIRRSAIPMRGAGMIAEFGDTLLHVAIEHRLMHAETLAYLLHNLPVDRKILAARRRSRSSARAAAISGHHSAKALPHLDRRAGSGEFRLGQRVRSSSRQRGLVFRSMFFR